MVAVSHLFFLFMVKKLGDGVTRYESHPPSLRTVYFPTAPFSSFLGNGVKFFTIEGPNKEKVEFSQYL